MNLFILISAVIAGIICYLVILYHDKRTHFVRASSNALHNLNDINSKYSFISIPCLDMKEYYDNRSYYDTISPKDYLTYQLVYQHKTIKKAIDDASANNQMLTQYHNDIDASCVLGKFDATTRPERTSRLDRLLIEFWLTKGFKQLCETEKNIFNSDIQKPTISLNVKVILFSTNINGQVYHKKSATFSTHEILQIIADLHKKTNGFYSDPEIWQAICRVERGKVSNKMRFAIYRRDGNRCLKCGSTKNLEVDHIYPISKGGKTTFDNLQTLCHRCNTQKSNLIEPNAISPKGKYTQGNKVCPYCNIPLVKRKGSYGEFWSCQNYPKCKYTAK